MIVHHPTRQVFGEQWDALSVNEMYALIADVQAVAEELSADYVSAARELARRIGGADNLANYVKCLTARNNRLAAVRDSK